MSKFFAVFATAVFILLVAGLADAQSEMDARDHVWTDEDFAALARPATVPLPVGTEITTENWQQYKDYMSLGMQTLFRGDRFFKILPGQKLIVGTTTSVPLPKLFQAATEKYSGTDSIVPAPEIGPDAVTIKNYRGGVPFPNPKEPDLGTKVLYNSWFSYSPAVVHIAADAYLVDKFHDRSPLIVDAVVGKTSYVADPGFPETNPMLPDIARYTYDEVVLPEEAKYSAVLDEWHRDPVKFTDLYAYVPSLRRVLRLSAAAVCAPVVGSDGVNDDNCTNIGVCYQIPLFQVTLLSERKMLGMVRMKAEAFKAGTNNLPSQQYFYSSEKDIAAAGFDLPKPSAGPWELRDMYVLKVRRVPSLSKGYCYGTRIAYIDKETWHGGITDVWDAQQKYWKGQMCQFPTLPIPGTNDMYFGDSEHCALFDFQNYHTTGYLDDGVGAIDHDAGKYQDITRYATPGGLQQINQ